MIHIFVDLFSSVQGWLFEMVVQPFLFHAGLGEFTEQAFEGTEWFLVGVCELTFLYCLLRPLESLIPVHDMTDPGARWNDFIYTALHRLGAFSIAVFFVLDPLMDRCTAVLHLHGIPTFNLDSVWPGITDKPLASFLLYLVALDFFDYWYHRAEHRFNWWWGLHHSQQNMNLWSDNRNHLFDDLLRDIYMAIIALVIGIQPGQYVLLISVSRMLQSLQHANVRIHYGLIGERILASPRYHRLHHAIGIGHETHGKNTLGGHNFAVLFPVWDLLFGTALFSQMFAATEVREQLQLLEGEGKDYGRGFWSQQWLGLKRMVAFSNKAAS